MEALLTISLSTGTLGSRNYVHLAAKVPPHRKSCIVHTTADKISCSSQLSESKLPPSRDNASVLVLTTPCRRFIDIRLSDQCHRIESVPTKSSSDHWVFAGRSTSTDTVGAEGTKEQHCIWHHVIDNRSATPDQVVDEGVCNVLPSGDVLERGLINGEEMGELWLEEAVRCFEGATDGSAGRVAVALTKGLCLLPAIKDTEKGMTSGQRTGDGEERCPGDGRADSAVSDDVKGVIIRVCQPQYNFPVSPGSSSQRHHVEESIQILLADTISDSAPKIGQYIQGFVIGSKGVTAQRWLYHEKGPSHPRNHWRPYDQSGVCTAFAEPGSFQSEELDAGIELLQQVTTNDLEDWEVGGSVSLGTRNGDVSRDCHGWILEEFSIF